MNVLMHKTILYIPLEYGDEETISKNHIDIILSSSIDRLVDLGGGTTVLDGEGYWKKNDRVNKMKTKIIVTYVEDKNEAYEVLTDISLFVKEETRSDSICFEIDGKLHIV